MRREEHWTMKYFTELGVWVLIILAGIVLLCWMNGCSNLPVVIEGRTHHSKDACLNHLANVESTLSRPDVLVPGEKMRIGNARYVQKKRSECGSLP